MDLVELIRNEELIYFVGSSPGFRSTFLGHFSKKLAPPDPQIQPYPGLRIEFPSQGVSLPVADHGEFHEEPSGSVFDPKTGSVIFKVQRTRNGAKIFSSPHGSHLGVFELEALPTIRRCSGYIKDSKREVVIRIKPIDRFIMLGPIKIYRLELGYCFETLENKKIADVMNLSFWSNNVTCRFKCSQATDDETLLLCFGACTAILAHFDFREY